MQTSMAMWIRFGKFAIFFAIIIFFQENVECSGFTSRQFEGELVEIGVFRATTDCIAISSISPFFYKGKSNFLSNNIIFLASVSADSKSMNKISQSSTEKKTNNIVNSHHLFVNFVYFVLGIICMYYLIVKFDL